MFFLRHKAPKAELRAALRAAAEQDPEMPSAVEAPEPFKVEAPDEVAVKAEAPGEVLWPATGEHVAVGVECSLYSLRMESKGEVWVPRLRTPLTASRDSLAATSSRA